MDELVQLDLIEAIADAEEGAQRREVPRAEMRNALEELSNREFVKAFRVTKELFEFIVEILRPLMKEKIAPKDIDIPLKILIALKFFAVGTYQLDVGLNSFVCVSQASVSRCITEVTDALNHPTVFHEYVKFPENFEQLNEIRRRFYEKFNFPGIIGCIDCTHVAIVPPQSNHPEFPEHLYVNRKGYHSINVQLICDDRLRILNVVAQYPGSTNDAFIWNSSNAQTLLQRLHARGHKDYFLLGDSGYPLRTWLMTPLEQQPPPDTPQYRYNITHKRSRTLIEHCNGLLKGRFRCLLKDRVLHYLPQNACKIINACTVLHNLCILHHIPEPEGENFEDFGLYEALQVHDNIDMDAMRQINPELAEGRRARERLIQNAFRN